MVSLPFSIRREPSGLGIEERYAPKNWERVAGGEGGGKVRIIENSDEALKKVTHETSTTLTTALRVRFQNHIKYCYANGFCFFELMGLCPFVPISQVFFTVILKLKILF